MVNVAYLVKLFLFLGHQSICRGLNCSDEIVVQQPTDVTDTQPTVLGHITESDPEHSHLITDCDHKLIIICMNFVCQTNYANYLPK